MSVYPTGLPIASREQGLPSSVLGRILCNSQQAVVLEKAPAQEARPGESTALSHTGK